MHYIVIGRLEFKEDESMTLEAESPEAAQATFEQELREMWECEPEAVIYISHVLQSETPITRIPEW